MMKMPESANFFIERQWYTKEELKSIQTPLKISFDDFMLFLHDLAIPLMYPIDYSFENNPMFVFATYDWQDRTEYSKDINVLYRSVFHIEFFEGDKNETRISFGRYDRGTHTTYESREEERDFEFNKPSSWHTLLKRVFVGRFCGHFSMKLSHRSHGSMQHLCNWDNYIKKVRLTDKDI